MTMFKLALLDDYQLVALAVADWSQLEGQCEIHSFDRHLADEQDAVNNLLHFDGIVVMRDRMALPRSLLERLPRLRFIGVIGTVARTVDLLAARDLGIVVSHTTASLIGLQATAEFAWALVMAAARCIPQADAAMRRGEWQSTLGRTLQGKTLGLLGLGRVGQRVAQFGHAFGMNVVAWSQNLTDEVAAAAGAKRIDKNALLERSDVVSIHLQLSDRTRSLVGARELALMKPSALLVNTSRAGIVDADALLETLHNRHLFTAALDVFDSEPLAVDHPLRQLDNVVLTPHLGYVTEENHQLGYQDSVENILRFLEGKPVRLLNSGVLPC